MKIFLLMILILVSCTYGLRAKCEKIVSLAPAVTEIVFELGKGDCLIGNTQFCDYPEAAKSIPKVGAKLDLNLEILVSMQPDIIILYPSYQEKVKILANRSRLLVVDHRNLEGLFQSIPLIASALNVEPAGKELLSRIQARLNEVKVKAAKDKKVKTLLIAGRNRDQLRNMYIIGRKDFLNDILEIAGGVNVYKGNIDYPNISLESVVNLNPDVIIELSIFYQQIDEKKVIDLWAQYPYIEAVKNKRIMVVKDNVWLRPGPRVGEIAEKLYELLHHRVENDTPTQ